MLQIFSSFYIESKKNFKIQFPGVEGREVKITRISGYNLA
jgi:hypothetical protein